MKKSFYYLTAILLCLAGFLLTACNKKTASSAKPLNALEAIKARGVFILGHEDSFPPLGFIDGNGESAGYDIDLAKEVAKRMGVDFKTRIVVWEDIKKELDAGNVDCIWNGFTITAERENIFEMSFPYLANEQVLVVRNTSSVKSYDDLSGRVIGYRKATSSRDAIDANPALKNIVGDIITYKDNSSAFADLKVGALDAVVIDSVAADYYIAQTGEPFAIIPTPLADEKYVVGFKKGETELKNEVERILKEMEKDGTVAEISKKWFGKDLSIIR